MRMRGHHFYDGRPFGVGDLRSSERCEASLVDDRRLGVELAALAGAKVPAGYRA